MKVKKYVLSFFVLTLIILTIINPKSNMENFLNGLSVWSTCVVPALFPFLFFTKILTSLEVIEKASRVFSPITKKIYNVGGISGYIYSMSVMSGYPLSASMIADFYEKGLISRYEAVKINAFSSTSGPLFIVGSVAIGMCGNFKLGIVILISHFIGALLNGILYRNYGKKQKLSDKYKVNVQVIDNSMESCMLSSIKSILMIGGYICLSFVIIGILNDLKIITALATFISKIFKLDANIVNGLLNGILEVTKGSLDLSNIVLNTKSLAIFLTFLVSFGGFSIILQASSFLNRAKISIGLFILQKTTQSIISVLVCLLISLIFKL